MVPPLLAAFVLDLGGCRRRFSGAIPMLLGPLLLVVTVLAACGIEGLGLPLFVAGVSASVCLCWWGYRMQRSGPRESPGQKLLAMLASPVPSRRTLRPDDVLGAWQFSDWQNELVLLARDESVNNRSLLGQRSTAGSSPPP